ncbi:uncharacterized protein C24B11.05-like [Impatiens glandulifera]|uniref:uncharacterized protein C24B11.05-like n=1 Tax=Impatiens glandulifera TaxID=253017 RepID=UPI001FB161AF|nr:uncharacterized protein C24B11.05-like [Impatiens glandulifera]
MDDHQGSKYDCLLFDIDDTVYPNSSGLSSQCTNNIIEFMTKNLGVDEHKAPQLCVSLYKEYGTTMAGLKATGYDFDYDHFHRFVHGRLPYEILKPDPALKSILQSLPIRKVVFSNANRDHVNMIINKLGLEGCFDDMICFETLNNQTTSPFILCKPSDDAFKQAFIKAKINIPHKTLFFDDSIRNLQTAKRMRLHTVWVGSAHREAGVDLALESIHNMREALPELWEDGDKNVSYSRKGKVGIETYVRA